MVLYKPVTSLPTVLMLRDMFNSVCVLLVHIGNRPIFTQIDPAVYERAVLLAYVKRNAEP